MAAHRETPWLKRVLIPFWILRFLLMGFLLAVYIHAIVLATETLEDNGSSINSTIIAAIILIGLIAVCLFLDFVAILMFSFHSLSPLIFLIFNVIQTAIWIALFILDILGALTNTIDQDDSSEIYNKYGGWIVSIVVLAVFIGLLIYASVVYHRHRMAKRRYLFPTDKGIDYQYQQEDPFDAYRIPTPQPFSPFSPDTAAPAVNHTSRHIDLDVPRKQRSTEFRYVPPKPSPLSISQRAESPSPITPDHSAPEVVDFAGIPRTKSPMNFLNTPTSPSSGEIPVALMPGQGQSSSSHQQQQSPYESGSGNNRFVLSRKSLSEYQERIYGTEQQGPTYELADRA